MLWEDLWREGRREVVVRGFDGVGDGTYSVVEVDDAVSGDEGGVPWMGVLGTVLAGEGGKLKVTLLRCLGDGSSDCLRGWLWVSRGRDAGGLYLSSGRGSLALSR